MKMKKVVAVVTAAAMLTLSLGAFVGCGKSDEDVIRNALTEELDAIKTLDSDYMNQMVAEMEADEFSEFGIDPLEFMSQYLSGFDYTIDSVTVDGDTAEAVVTLTVKSFSAYNSAVEANTYAAIETTDFSTMTESDLNLFIGNLMMTSLEDVEAVQTDPITIEYVLEGAGWTPTTASEQAITNAMLTN